MNLERDSEQNKDLICPKHKVRFSLIERSIQGKRICPYGDVWRAKGEVLVECL